MVDATFITAVALAIIAGISTFFSPCAYPLLPGYVGYYASQTDGTAPSLEGSFVRGLVAGGGVLIALVGLMWVAFIVGHSTVSNVVYFEPIVGAFLVVFGALVFLDRAPSLTFALPKRRSSTLGFGVFGAGYALAAAGCVIPVFLGVLGLALSQSPGGAIVVLGTYIGSVTVLMISLTVATGMGLAANAGKIAAHAGTLKRIAGGVMIAAGVGQLYLAIFVLNVF